MFNRLMMIVTFWSLPLFCQRITGGEPRADGPGRFAFRRLMQQQPGPRGGDNDVRGEVTAHPVAFDLPFRPVHEFVRASRVQAPPEAPGG